MAFKEHKYSSLYYLIQIVQDGSYVVSPEHSLIYEKGRALRMNDAVDVMWPHTVKEGNKKKTVTKQYSGEDKDTLHALQDAYVAKDETDIQLKKKKAEIMKQKKVNRKVDGKTSSENDSNNDLIHKDKQFPGNGEKKVKKDFLKSELAAGCSSSMKQVNETKKSDMSKVLASQNADIAKSLVQVESPSKNALKQQVELCKMKAALLEKQNEEISALAHKRKKGKKEHRPEKKRVANVEKDLEEVQCEEKSKDEGLDGSKYKEFPDEQNLSSSDSESDDNASKFTGEMFRFKKSDRNVLELGSGIFCSQIAVNNLDSCSTYSTIARALLTSVFSDEALRTSPLKGRFSVTGGIHPRPALENRQNWPQTYFKVRETILQKEEPPASADPATFEKPHYQVV